MKRALAILLALGLSAANADPAYVSDKLVVNVYAEPDQASAKVDTIETGDAMEVLDRTDGGFAHVKLANGREGYVRASYLTASAPAINRLKDVEKQNAALKSKAAPARAPAACPTVTSTAPTPMPAAKECPVQQAVPATTVVNGFSPTFASALAFAGVVVGFALGYRTLASRIRKKYRGLKVY